MSSGGAWRQAKKAFGVALCAGITAGFALGAAAQAPTGRAGHEVAPEMRWHHEMGSLMRELSQAIDRMGAQMVAAPASSREMAARMKELSGMLDRMSGLEARPAHGPEDQAQLAGLRKRLRELAADGAAVSRTRPAPSVEERMGRIEDDLQALDAQMQRVRDARDAAERSRLLGEHARALRGTMAGLRELDRVFSPQMRAMMGGGAHGISADRMMQVHDLMNRRVALMERAMEQVMEQSMVHGEEAPR